MRVTFKLSTSKPFYICGRNAKGQYVDLMKTATGDYVANVWDVMDFKEQKFPGSTPFVEVIQFLNS